MSVLVVDGFEFVEVQEDDGGGVVSFGGGVEQFVVEGFEGGCSVGEAGELVVGGAVGAVFDGGVEVSEGDPES